MSLPPIETSIDLNALLESINRMVTSKWISVSQGCRHTVTKGIAITHQLSRVERRMAWSGIKAPEAAITARGLDRCGCHIMTCTLEYLNGRYMSRANHIDIGFPRLPYHSTSSRQKKSIERHNNPCLCGCCAQLERHSYRSELSYSQYKHIYLLGALKSPIRVRVLSRLMLNSSWNLLRGGTDSQLSSSKTNALRLRLTVSLTGRGVDSMHRRISIHWHQTLPTNCKVIPFVLLRPREMTPPFQHRRLERSTVA